MECKQIGQLNVSAATEREASGFDARQANVGVVRNKDLSKSKSVKASKKYNVFLHCVFTV